MTKLAILHYLPLEYYPPITNLIDYLTNEHIDDFKQIKVYSTHNIKGRQAYQITDSAIELKAKRSHQLISLFRSPFPTEKDNSLIRLLKYLLYNIFTLLRLICYRANVLVYYESYSAWPAYVYTKFFNRNCRLFIHNHEYASKDWYSNTMKQVQYFHRLEKQSLYPRAHWLSQTNTDRLRFFHNDHPYLKKEQLRIMPNYPPKEWSKGSGYKMKGERLKTQGSPQTLNTEPTDNTATQQPNLKPSTSQLLSSSNPNSEPVKLVYIGSLSLSNTYLEGFCQWLDKQKGALQFDIYSYNLHADTIKYLDNLNSPYISFNNKGIEYADIPSLLSQYDVGIIFYKAYSENLINCV
jgi:hypothetical protein